MVGLKTSEKIQVAPNIFSIACPNFESLVDLYSSNANVASINGNNEQLILFKVEESKLFYKDFDVLISLK